MLLSILLSIIGFAILFIVLTNVVLFCLETKAVGIIISIIGILSFLSGGHIDVLAKDGFDGEIDGHFVLFYGTCGKCKENEKNS